MRLLWGRAFALKKGRMKSKSNTRSSSPWVGRFRHCHQKLASEIDSNNKVGCMLAAGQNYPHTCARRCLGGSRRKTRTISSLMCRRVGNTQTMLKSGNVRESRLRWPVGPSIIKKEAYGGLYFLLLLLIGSFQGISWKGENNRKYLSISREKSYLKLQIGLADWPSWSPHYLEHHLGSLLKT